MENLSSCCETAGAGTAIQPALCWILCEHQVGIKSGVTPPAGSMETMAKKNKNNSNNKCKGRCGSSCCSSSQQAYSRSRRCGRSRSAGSGSTSSHCSGSSSQRKRSRGQQQSVHWQLHFHAPAARMLAFARACGRPCKVLAAPNLSGGTTSRCGAPRVSSVFVSGGRSHAAISAAPLQQHDKHPARLCARCTLCWRRRSAAWPRTRVRWLSGASGMRFGCTTMRASARTGAASGCRRGAHAGPKAVRQHGTPFAPAARGRLLKALAGPRQR